MLRTPVRLAALSALTVGALALSGGEPGSEIQAPMASVIIFGLITSTALNMLVVPAAYYALHARREAVTT